MRVIAVGVQACIACDSGRSAGVHSVRMQCLHLVLAWPCRWTEQVAKPTDDGVPGHDSWKLAWHATHEAAHTE
jgi:hypothetical protein